MYQGLSAAFSYRVEVSLDQVPGITAMLSMPRTDAPNGSSFAVTSDAKQGFRHIWLSEVSMHSLLDYLNTESFIDIPGAEVT
jgi:hypothetical protein